MHPRHAARLRHQTGVSKPPLRPAPEHLTPWSSLPSEPDRESFPGVANAHSLALRLWNNGIVYGLKRDQAVLKEVGFDAIRDAGSRGVSGPLQQEHIVREGHFISMLRLGKCLDHLGKECAYRALTTEHIRGCLRRG